MPAPLSAQTIAIIKVTVPALEAHGLDITRVMYRRLFENEEIRALFNPSHQGSDGAQPKALAGAILAYARCIDDPGALAGAIERIAQRHVGLSILPEHYPFVATALLGAIGEVLGAAATDEILSAWGEAYWFLADVLIGRETAIYREQGEAPGGWAGWRDFVVDRIEVESEIITSFYLKPLDGRPVIRHRAGQFLTFRLDLGDGATLKRNYSISSAPGSEGYRITVKREPEGRASGWLHDRVSKGAVLAVAPPAGEFVLEDGDAPVVLVSGGVGLTPMVSMLEAIAADRPATPVWYVHGTQNGRVHAMADHVRALAAGTPGITQAAFYAEPEANDVQGRHFNEQGFITVDWLRAQTPFDRATFYLCGPRPFLRALVGGLNRAGVPVERIRFEFFGPTDEVLAA